jgi:hypothetical protein
MKTTFPRIRQRCEELLHDTTVEGILFKYRHFWGDYDHYITSHAWYANEIRIVRNDPEIHSWESAQSFRRIPDFRRHPLPRKKGYPQTERSPGSTPISITMDGFAPPNTCRKRRKAFATIH